MARTTTKYNCFLKEVTLNEWTIEGGGTALEVIGRQTEEPSSPSTTKFLKIGTASKKAEGNLTLPSGLTTALASEGATVVNATVHINVKSTATGKKLIRFGTVTPAVSSEPESTTTTQVWFTVSLTKAQAEELTKTKLEELVLVAEHLGSTQINFYEIYLSVEVETETARLVRSSGHVAEKSPSGGGTVKVTVTEPAAGNDLFVSVATAVGVAAATTVTDNKSSSYVLDGEVNDGVHPTLQVWKAQGLASGITEVKVAIAGSLVLVDVAACEVAVIAGALDVKGTATGTTALATTELEASTSAKTNSGKGDFGIAFFASTGSLGTFTAGTGMTAFTGADQTGLSLGGEYTSTPAENATLTAKGKFSEAGLWSGAVIAYKVLSETENLTKALAASLTPAGATGRLTGRRVAGTVTGAGAIARMVSRSLPGTLTPGGAISRLASRTLAGTLGLAGALNRQTKRALAASLFSPLLAIGTSETGYSKLEELGEGEAECYRYQATATETLSSLEWYLGPTGQASTSVILGIYADSSGKPGKLLGHGTYLGTPPAKERFGVRGLSVPVVAGTYYWLAALSLGGRMPYYIGGEAVSDGEAYGFSGSALPEEFAWVVEPTYKRPMARGTTASGALAANIIETLFKTLTAALTPAGALAKTPIRSFAATVVPAGQMLRLTARSLLAAVPFGGTVSRRTARGLAGTLNIVGALARASQRALGGSPGLTGAIVRQPRRSLAGPLTPAGVANRMTARGLSATEAPGGVLGRGTARALTAVVSFAGAFARQTKRPLAGTLSPIGQLANNFAGEVIEVALAATLALGGAIGRQTRRTLAGTLIPGGAAGRAIRRALTGLQAPQGVLARRMGRSLTATLTIGGTVTRGTARVLGGALGMVGALVSAAIVRAPGLPGFSKPSQRRGRSEPSQVLGRSEPSQRSGE